MMRRLIKLISFAMVVAGGLGVPAMAQDAPSQILFANVSLFDGVSDELLEKANVLVEGNLIKTISTDEIDAGDATVIDGGGRTLMPGMMDMHTHHLTDQDKNLLVIMKDGVIYKNTLS